MIVSGIYKIRNIQNNHLYIGSAENIKRRWNKHRSDLRKGIHHSSHLQNAFNKYGESNFEFSILEYCEKFELISNEQAWINKLKPEYNIRPTAGSALGMKHSKETRAKIGSWHKGKTISDEQKQKISLTSRGNNNPRANLSDIEVIEIRRLWDSGVSPKEISKKFNTPKSSINNIISNYTWKHLPPCVRKPSNRGSSLSELDVLEMRRLYKADLSSTLIGKLFRLTQQQAWKVVNYWSWKDVA